MKTNCNPSSAVSETARLAFALLEKLDSGRRLPPPSISKVFRLYCIESLSAAQVAKQCRCSKPAVIRRLKLIRRKTGISPALLRAPAIEFVPLSGPSDHHQLPTDCPTDDEMDADREP